MLDVSELISRQADTVGIHGFTDVDGVLLAAGSLSDSYMYFKCECHSSKCQVLSTVFEPLEPLSLVGFFGVFFEALLIKYKKQKLGE